MVKRALASVLFCLTMSPEINEDEQVIPESLLAFTKDVRYLEECQELVSQVLSKILPSRRENRIDQDSWLASTLLYIILVVTRKGRTIGMEATGIKYSDKVARWKVVASSLIAATTLYTLRRITMAAETSSESNEALTGARRRQIFEEQRRAMIQRTQELSNSTQQTQQQQRSRNPASAAQRIRRFLAQLVHSITLSLSSLEPEGPHALAQTQQRSSLSIGTWLMRLHLAYYCLEGRHPTWLHRITSHTMQHDSSERLVNRPSNVRILGLLLFLQAAATGVQSLGKHLVRRCAEWTDYLFPATASGTSFKGRPTVATTQGGGTCAICHHVRKHPACPVACGHVFCWKCLQHWVDTNRPECPLCRAPCRPQDILALYDYAPAND